MQRTPGSCSLSMIAQWQSRHFYERIQPDLLRAPEVILGYPWGPSVDIWSLSCLVSILSVSCHPPDPDGDA